MHRDQPGAFTPEETCSAGDERFEAQKDTGGMHMLNYLGPTHADGRTWLRSSKAPLLHAQYYIQLCLHVLERNLCRRLRHTAGPPLRLRQALVGRLSTPSQSKLTRLRTCKRSRSSRFALPNQDSNAKPGAHHVVPFVSDKYSPDLGPKFLRGVKRIEKRVCLGG